MYIYIVRIYIVYTYMYASLRVYTYIGAHHYMCVRINMCLRVCVPI